MIHPLRAAKGRTGWYAVGLLALWGAVAPAPAHAQTCPPATSACTPGNAPATNAAYGMGILNVTLGPINNSTGGMLEGYRDYSCSLGAAALTIGVDAPISIRTNPNADENVRVWADLNNDGTFNPTGELVFSSNAKRQHTGTIRLPAGTTTGVRLRLRVAADYVNAPLPTPCSTPQYSQTEDYAITAAASTVAPTAEFVADQPRTCAGTVQFTDQSQNGPTGWLWNFGDGTTSTQQSPSHRYAAPGTYTVSLTATNAAGTNTRTRTNYVVYDNVVPVAASCTPATAAYCCGYGITQVSLGGLVKSSADGQAGYEDFTCAGKVELTVGGRYTLSVLTGAGNPHDTRAWLDLNNNGTFESNELIVQALNTSNPSIAYIVPGTATLNQPLRLRVAADYVGSTFTACGGIQYGQAEDYTVTLRPNTQPPVASFTSNFVAGTCQTTVQFTDQSQNVPTSWLWNFGDGTTSTQQNPSHLYTTAGTYSVSLKATNPYGSSTTTSTNLVQIISPCRQYCTALGNNSSFWITNVTLTAPQNTTFTNVSGADANGYGNYVSKEMTLRLGQTASLSVATNLAVQRVTTVWLDWNRDGVFASSELVANQISYNPSVMTVVVPNQANLTGTTRLRIIARLNNNTAYSCTGNVPQPDTEIEDYTVQIVPATGTQAAAALPGLAVYPNPTATGLVAVRLADAGAADAYELELTNAVGACVLRTTARLTPTADATLDLRALPRGLYMLRVRGAHGQTATRRLVRD